MRQIDDNEIPCGSLRWRSPKFCAERVVFTVKRFTDRRAVCVDPIGRITVEHPAQAVEEDLVGVFDPAAPLMELYRMVKDDLSAEAAGRGWHLRKAA